MQASAERFRVRRGKPLRTPRLPVGAFAAALLFAPAVFASGDSIVLEPDPEMLLKLIVLFTILIFPVNALLFRPIFAALDAREAKIAGTRARAQQLAAEADQTLRRYEDGIRQARGEAELERRKGLSTARAECQREAAEARGAAEREIEAARGLVQRDLELARASLRREAQQLAREVAGSVLGRPLK